MKNTCNLEYTLQRNVIIIQSVVWNKLFKAKINLLKGSCAFVHYIFTNISKLIVSNLTGIIDERFIEYFKTYKGFSYTCKIVRQRSFFLNLKDLIDKKKLGLV